MKLISYLFFLVKIYSKIIYHCIEESLSNSVCLINNKNYLGDMIYGIQQCPVNEFCQIRKKDSEVNVIGVCTTKIKKAREGESCAKGSECCSKYCSHNKCGGIGYKDFCVKGSYSCSKEYTCQKKYQMTYFNVFKEIYICDIPLQYGEECDNTNECDMKLVCGHYGNNTFKTCIERASLNNGEYTDEPMACRSGTLEIINDKSICVSRKSIINDCDTYTNYCNITINDGQENDTILTKKCVSSSLGENICPADQQEKYWQNYLRDWDIYFEENNIKKELNDKNFNIESYKDTFNNRDISFSFWQYKQWYYALDADECARDFFFLNSHGNYINILIIIKILLFLLLI